jgi:D-3-phosphoglycerate dehydrogenase
MYNITTLNKISSVGLELLTDDYKVIEDMDAAHAILLRSHPLHDMPFSENLLSIARAGAGVNNIPLDRCAEKGIVVFNTPGANANAVKELVLAGMFMSARKVTEGMAWAKTLIGTEGVGKAVEKGKNQFVGTELKGKTLGIIGLGAIGVMVANAAKDLGMKVIGCDPYITVKAAHDLYNTIEMVESLNDLYPKCDYITIHVPAIEQTVGMIDSKAFNKMKCGTVFLNFSRDKLVNENGLEKALASGKLRKYITDFPNDNVIGMDDVISIPHLGASTTEAEDNCSSMAVEQTMDYLENGNIVNSVNFPACSLGAIKKGTTRFCIINKNVPSILGKITSIFSDKGVNLENMINRSKGNYAYTLLEVIGKIDRERIMKELDLEEVVRARYIEG